MSKRDVRLFLLDMLDAIAKIDRYTRGLNFERFAQESLVVDAVVRNLEIIGEAAKHVPETMRQQYTGVKWKRVVGFRNIVVHEYFDVDIEIVWTIVKEQLPILKQVLQSMLADLDGN